MVKLPNFLFLQMYWKLNYIFNCFCSICGTLHSVDQYLNIKLTDISVNDTERYPHMLYVFSLSCFLRLQCRKRCTMYIFYIPFSLTDLWKIASFVALWCDMFSYRATKSTRNCFKMLREKKQWQLRDKRFAAFLVKHLRRWSQTEFKNFFFFLIKMVYNFDNF